MGFDEEEEYDDEDEEEEKPVRKKPGKKATKKKEAKEKYMVVKELPTQVVRKYEDEETGEITNFLTIEEALSDMENHFKSLTGGL